jgi:hypothetical protein
LQRLLTFGKSAIENTKDIAAKNDKIKLGTPKYQIAAQKIIAKIKQPDTGI